MAYARGSSGIMGPWELWRKASFGLSILVFIAMAILVNLPVGVGAFFLLIVFSSFWRPVFVLGADPRKGSYTPDTPAHKAAKYFMVYRQKVRSREVFSPRILFGAGQTVTDIDHNLEPGWMPPTRLSFYWSAVFSIGVAFLDVLIHPAVHVLGSDVRMPVVASYVLSFIGWMATSQAFMYALRARDNTPGSQRIVAVEPRPATMLHLSKLHIEESIVSFLVKSSLIGLGIVVFISILWATFKWPAPITVPILLIAFVLPFLIVISVKLKNRYSAQWKERSERRREWEAILEFMKQKTPQLLFETKVPTLEQWESEGHPDDEPYDPKVNVATFSFATNCNFLDYIDIEDRIAGELMADSVAVFPVGKADPETGEEIPGTVGNRMFRIWWSEEGVDMESMLNPSIDDWMLQLGARSIIEDKVSRVRGIGHVIVKDIRRMTRARSESQVLQVTLSPQNSGTSLGSFLNAIPEMSKNLDVPWVRAYSAKTVNRDGNSVTLMIGQDPSAKGTKFKNPPSVAGKIIDEANWSYYNHVNGIVGPQGDTPKFVQRRKSTEMVDELQFELPAGMDFSLIKNKINGGLKTTSQNNFMEVDLGITDEDGKFQSSKDMEGNAKYTIIASKNDPLQRVFPFNEYRDKILTGREEGVYKMEWCPGVLSNDQLARDSFDAEEPHLLIAGSSGSGKSVVVQNMICQLGYNNGPNELNFWMIEPKIGLQRFKNMDVTKRFLDSWSLDGEPREGTFLMDAANMSYDAVEEMKRRNKIMSGYKSKTGMMPEKLEEARAIALEEIADGTWDSDEPHPLIMPILVLIVEECASVYQGASPGDKEEAGYQAEFNQNMTRLAREGRSAGVFVINITQYPTNASIPSVVRQQMRRIGLRCKNALASRVVIEENGLEELRGKGAGKILEKGSDSFRQFRGLFLRNGKTKEDNDIISILSDIPVRDDVEVTANDDPEMFVLPDLSKSVFQEWSRSRRKDALERAVDEQKQTKADKSIRNLENA